MKVFFFGSMLIVGFLLLLGAAGASDAEAITFEKAIIYSLIGLLAMIGGSIGLRFS